MVTVILVTWVTDVEGLSEASLGKRERLYLKNKTKAKRTRGLAQVVECLRLLSSNPSTRKERKRKEAHNSPTIKISTFTLYTFSSCKLP
jgi:hypothetical protein